MSSGADSQQPSYIILLSIDGMANFYLQEPQVRMPHLRSLIKQGVVANAMKSVFPTATWAIHSSIVTGTYPRKHGILGNWVMNRSTKSVGEYFSDSTWGKEDILQRETIYDTAKRLGWTTASVCWPVTREAKSIDYNIPEFYDQDLFYVLYPIMDSSIPRKRFFPMYASNKKVGSIRTDQSKARWQRYPMAVPDTCIYLKKTPL